MTNKKNASNKTLDPDVIEKKVDLIEKGLPIDISEKELEVLESTLRGARSFYIDMIQALMARQDAGEDVEKQIIEENANLASVEMALRSIDDFRREHRGQIK